MIPILDVCCGGKMFYFDKNDSRVLFQDIREIETELCDGRHFEVKPDVIGDFTNMKFEDNSFSMVVFNPPHLKYTGSKKECDGWQMTKYGNLYDLGYDVPCPFCNKEKFLESYGAEAYNEIVSWVKEHDPDYECEYVEVVEEENR